MKHKILKCPICLENTRKSTIMCKNYHKICNKCYIKCAFSGAKCPICRLTISRITFPSVCV